MAKVESCAHRHDCADLVRAVSAWRAEYNDAAAERDKLARRVKRLERLIVRVSDFAKDGFVMTVKSMLRDEAARIAKRKAGRK